MYQITIECIVQCMTQKPFMKQISMFSPKQQRIYVHEYAPG